MQTNAKPLRSQYEERLLAARTAEYAALEAGSRSASKSAKHPAGGMAVAPQVSEGRSATSPRAAELGEQHDDTWSGQKLPPPHRQDKTHKAAAAGKLNGGSQTPPPATVACTIGAPWSNRAMPALTEQLHAFQTEWPEATKP
jgi:hypothetical protein